MADYKVDERLLQGEADREAFKQQVINAKKVLDKVAKILYNEGVELENTVLGDYDTPSWSHKQAHRNGRLEQIRKTSAILTVKEREG